MSGQELLPTPAEREEKRPESVEPPAAEEPEDSEVDTKGRRKIEISFIENKSRRHITFSKRKAGIMKKAYELATLTGTQVLLLVASETGHVYTFATPKLQPLITNPEGKNLIQACLNAPDNKPMPEPKAVHATPQATAYMTAEAQKQRETFYPVGGVHSGIPPGYSQADVAKMYASRQKMESPQQHRLADPRMQHEVQTYGQPMVSQQFPHIGAGIAYSMPYAQPGYYPPRQNPQQAIPYSYPPRMPAVPTPGYPYQNVPNIRQEEHHPGENVGSSDEQ